MDRVGVYILVILFVSEANFLGIQANSIQKSPQFSHHGNSAYRNKYDRAQSKAADTSLLQLSMKSQKELDVFETVAGINRPSIEKSIEQKSIPTSKVNSETGVLYIPVRDVHAPSCEKGQNFKKRFPGSCRKYYECNNGVLTINSCYWFKNFDIISQSCRFYYFVDCSITEPPTTTSATITTSIFETTSSVIFTEYTTISNHTTYAPTNVSSTSSSISSLKPTFKVTSAPPFASKSTTQMSTSLSTTASSFSPTNSTGFTLSSPSSNSTGFPSSSSTSSISSISTSFYTTRRPLSSTSAVTESSSLETTATKIPEKSTTITADTSASTTTSIPKSTSTSFPSTTSKFTASPLTSSTNTPIATTHGATSSSSSTQTVFSPESTSANVSSTPSLTTKPSLPTTISIFSTSTPTTVTVTAPTTQYPDLPRCSPGQYYKKRYPNDCHRFYFCRNGTLEIWICNAFYNFDAITLTCKVFWEVDCTIGM